MSTPVIGQQPPPAVEGTQQAYTAHSGHGSVGPVIAVLAVITILGVIAGMIGRLCTGRRIMGSGQYDFEGWVERKCSSCLDGSIDPAPHRTTRPDIPVEEPVVVVEEAQAQAQAQAQPQPQPQPQQQEEIKEEEHVQEPVHQENRQAKKKNEY